MNLIGDNTLVGSSDFIPGIKNSILPKSLKDLVNPKILNPVEFQTLYAHNVRISSMNEVEAVFAQFLRDWKAFPEDSAVNSKPAILERRLSVSPHNTWRPLGGAPCFVSLNRQEGTIGTFHSSGALKILNFPLHPLISLIFKLEYRVEFTNASTNQKETKDFVIGWCLYVPAISNDFLVEGEIQLDLLLGPGLTLFGDVLWDQTLARKDQRRLFVKLAFILSASEESQAPSLSLSPAERRAQEELMLREAQSQIQKTVSTQMEQEKRREQERLKAV